MNNNDILATAKKHMPGVLTAVSIGSMAMAVVTAVSNTPKALALIEEKKQEENVEELTPKEIVKTIWKVYIPTAVLMAVSATCSILANSIYFKESAVLTAAYILADKNLREYTAKVAESVGEKKEMAIRDALSSDEIQKNPVSRKTIIVTDKGESLCYDPLSGRYFTYDIERLKQAVNKLNRDMNIEQYVSLNDFYAELNSPKIKSIEIGDSLGWNVNDGLIDIYLSAQVTNELKPCLVINHRVPPKYGYDRLI